MHSIASAEHCSCERPSERSREAPSIDKASAISAEQSEPLVDWAPQHQFGLLAVAVFESSSYSEFSTSTSEGKSIMAVARGTREDVAMKSLLEAQDEELPGIIKELEAGHKKSCWIWYVMPTSMPGMCEPRGTFVTKSTAKRLFEKEERANNWRKVLELICDQVEKDGMEALPRIDHGRLHYFLKEWKEMDHGSEWLADVIGRLDKFDWPSR